MKEMLKTFVAFSIAGILAFWVYTKDSTEFNPKDVPIITEDSPPCLQMYYLIEKYSEKYNVPREYAYGIAYSETRYKEPFQWDYNHKQTSCVGAVGPMQIMYTTAQMMWPGKKFTKTFLKDNIEFNVETSMKLLQHLHNRYGDWKKVFGCYNTGRPMINQYALNVYNYKPNF